MIIPTVVCVLPVIIIPLYSLCNEMCKTAKISRGCQLHLHSSGLCAAVDSSGICAVELHIHQTSSNLLFSVQRFSTVLLKAAVASCSVAEGVGSGTVGG